MNEIDRHQIILASLQERQFVTVNDLSDLVDASPATVRRDIVKLDEKGLLRKVHGGIAPRDALVGGVVRGKPYRENEVLNVVQKQAIAAAGVELCNNGDTVFIHAGSTCSIFSQRLGEKSLRIVTNSIAVAEHVWRLDTCQLHLLGGDLYREPAILHAPQRWEEEFFVDKCFLGTLGLCPEGLLENNPMLARVSKAIADRSSEVIVLADSSKFGIRPQLLSLSMARVSSLITDDGISDRDARMIEEAGIRLIVATPPR
ncbi:MAG: DeoR/GlpR family DNA-binding transcription regulator [Roseinatronobacter sp.]